MLNLTLKIHMRYLQSPAAQRVTAAATVAITFHVLAMRVKINECLISKMKLN